MNEYLAAGLEDSIISVISPPWNRTAAPKKETISSAARDRNDKPDNQLDRPSNANLISDKNEEAQNSEGATSKLISDNSIGSLSLIVQPTYHRQGFFNIGVVYESLFGNDGEKIEIYCGDCETPIIGSINRTANSNRTPRIMGGKGLKDWLQSNVSVMESVQVIVLSPMMIKIRKCPENSREIETPAE